MATAEDESDCLKERLNNAGRRTTNQEERGWIRPPSPILFGGGQAVDVAKTFQVEQELTYFDANGSRLDQEAGKVRQVAVDHQLGRNRKVPSDEKTRHSPPQHLAARPPCSREWPLAINPWGAAKDWAKQSGHDLGVVAIRTTLKRYT